VPRSHCHSLIAQDYLSRITPSNAAIVLTAVREVSISGGMCLQDLWTVQGKGFKGKPLLRVWKLRLIALIAPVLASPDGPEHTAVRNHTHHRHLLLLLSPKADTHFTVPRRVEGWVDLGTAVRVHSPCPRLYIVVMFTINMQLPAVGFEPQSSHTAVRHVLARPLRPAVVFMNTMNEEENLEVYFCWVHIK